MQKEILIFEKLSILIEDHILLMYGLPSLVFVSPHKPKLIERIEKGMSRLIDSSEFFNIFWDHFKDVFSKYNVVDREVIILHNKRLSKPVRNMIKRHGLWLPDEVKKLVR